MIISKLLKWFRPRKESQSNAALAKELSQRIAEKAEKLHIHLDRYQRAKEPAVALFTDVYTARQVNRIHYGLNGKSHG